MPYFARKSIMPELFGVTFCPFFIPLKRRLQTAAVCIGTALLFLGHSISFAVVLLLFLSPWWPVSILYLAWMLIIDSQTSSKGGRPWDFVRNLTLWKYFCDYFPVRLHATSILSPEKNYIFGYHPHGVIGMGAVGNFATNATGFSKAFPGLVPHLLTLKVLFKVPIFRELMLWLGLCDVSKDSIWHICSRKDGGNVAVILIGGAEESLVAVPGSTSLVLNSRKGFIRMALMTGASLVPVYAFGENDVFKQVSNERGSWLRSIQSKFKNVASFAPVIFHGRGIFQYNFGFLPYRRPINVVVGAPISVKKMDDPKMADIDRVHGLYVQSLKELYNNYKDKYAKDTQPNLVIL